ncbi:FAD dependent oxidoreductase [Alkaliphilus metalliredigens QYMF]|uniref:FAD dependent oxidoreductase n=1 Tax=Alkaliphilus metalliredigens (strain QYMF) TaxID=293826 RepID=A6TLX2_ALKMQ|nr:NAD(P)/FAD-dependent oxidoreductase [Alkaliphilus metalliredigens]ABR47190.1 FAD dependent oxidoreductase [Alkaliphilus metalliredigens QYMF]
MYDITVIGAGITGTFIARELSRYQLRVLLVDKENDIANGTTKANSAIVHAGYDATEGTLKAKLNVRGNELYEKVCQELHVPFKRIGSLVLAFNQQEVETVQELFERGIKNGVPQMEILDKESVLKLENNLSEEVVGALYAKTGGIVGPWELAIALAENALENGVELLLNSPVTDMKKIAGGYCITAGDRKIESKIIINCAGIHTDDINNMINSPSFEILPNRGEYNLFDKSVGNVVNSVVFRCPSEAGKGVLIMPTVHGNLLVGPTSEYVENKTSVETTFEGLTFINDHTKHTLKEISFQNVITSFTGLRAKTRTQDFIIEESKESQGFFNVAGIDSPGLTAAPAIAEYVIELVKARIENLEIKQDFNPNTRPNIHFMELPDSEKAKLIEKDPRFGRIICRCENITEGEIVDVIKRKAGATTLDGVKRRARPGSGRCQGGFCAPRVMEILAREQGTDVAEVVKDGLGSYILTGKTK